MSDPDSRLLPESHSPLTLIDDLYFTDVTANGEIYTLYRVVRFTHELFNHPLGWTHLANVASVRKPALGVAHLLIVDRVVHESSVRIVPIDEA